MIEVLKFPNGEIKINHDDCNPCCGDCIEACTGDALGVTNHGQLTLDVDKCQYCESCSYVCPNNCISFNFRGV